MNRFINALLLFLLFPTMAVAIFVGFDLPVEFLRTTGGHMTYSTIIFLILGVLILMVNLRRSIRRWMGMILVFKTAKFKWNKPVGKDRTQRIIVYTLLESMVFGFVAFGLYELTTQAWLPALAFLVPTVDNLIFLLVGLLRKGFRVGVTTKAVIMADRDVQLVYFSGLRKVSIHQDSLYFDYIKDLQLFFPLDSIDPQDRDSFFDSLSDQLDKDKVFVTTKRN